MTNQPINVVSSPNVEGNIGSCEVKVSTMPVSSFYVRAIATNSCTGQIVGDNTYYDWGYIYGPAIVIVTVFVFGMCLKYIFNH